MAIGALVQKPLTSIMSVGKDRRRSARRARRARRVGTAGIPYQDGLPEDDPRAGRRRPRQRQEGQRRLQPRAGDAVQEGRRDARRFWNYEGVQLQRAHKRPDDHPRRPAPACRPTTSSCSSRARRDLRTPRRAGPALPAGAGARPPARCAQRPGAGRRRAARRPTRTSSAASSARRCARRCRCSSPSDAAQAVRLAGPAPVGGLRASGCATTSCSSSRSRRRGR